MDLLAKTFSYRKKNGRAKKTNRAEGKNMKIRFF